MPLEVRAPVDERNLRSSATKYAGCWTLRSLITARFRRVRYAFQLKPGVLCWSAATGMMCVTLFGSRCSTSVICAFARRISSDMTRRALSRAAADGWPSSSKVRAMWSTYASRSAADAESVFV